jgi:hypothetical protein
MQTVRWTSSSSLLVLCILLIRVPTSAQVNRNPSLASTKKARHTALIWVRVSPANEEFRVWMPESPQTGTERLVIDKQQVTVTCYVLDQGGTDYAVLSVSGLENKNAYLAHMLMLNLYGKSIPKSLIDKNEASVKATFQRNILLNGYLGHEYKIEAGNRTGVWRFYSVDKKFYVIAASTARNENILLSRFLESFALGATTTAINSNSAQPQLNVKAQKPPPASTGTWLVIVQTFAKAERSKANKRLGLLRSLGYDVHLVDTDDYPTLRRGFLAVTIGPQSKGATEHALNKVRSVAPEAYLKSGW